MTGCFLKQLRPDLLEDEIEMISEHPVLMEYDWPGNVRELKNFAERFAVLFTRDKNSSDLIYSLFNRKMAPVEEEEMITKALKETGGNRAKAARILGMSRTSLWRKLAKRKLSLNAEREEKN